MRTQARTLGRLRKTLPGLYRSPMKYWRTLNRADRYSYLGVGLILFALVSATMLVFWPTKHPIGTTLIASRKTKTIASLPAPASRLTTPKTDINSGSFSSNPAGTNSGMFSSNPTWSQDFSSMPNGSLSNKVWSYDIGNGGSDNPGWGNNEDEYYTSNPSNVRIENGELILEAQKQSEGGFNYTSARIKTTPSLNFTYGKLDIVAELPSGVGSWPAMWMLATNGIYESYTQAAEQDPNNYLHDGEIDMLEATGSIPGQITSSAQSYVYNPSNNNERIAETNVDNNATAFHDYGLEWTPTSLSFLVDGVAYHTVNKAATDTTDIWPYNQPYYLILNIAMGGTEGGTETQQYPPYGIDDSSGPWEMAVKSINYYSYTGN